MKSDKQPKQPAQPIDDEADTGLSISRRYLLGDLCKLVIREIQELQIPWGALPEKEQQRVIERVTANVKEAVRKTVDIRKGCTTKAERRNSTHKTWDLLIAHPPCTRLTNSGVRWLHVPPPGKTKQQMWDELEEAAEFYRTLRDAPIPRKALENPVMHCHARERLGNVRRHVVQPWWFGDPAFKATGFELIGLPPLEPTNKLTPPKAGTDEHKAWSWVHRAPPSTDRWKQRSRTFQGIADAMAEQWGEVTHNASFSRGPSGPSAGSDSCTSVADTEDK